MVKVNSTVDYLQVRFYILFLSNIAPISICYCLVVVAYPVLVQTFRSQHLFWAIECWLLAETIFYFFFYLPLKHHLNQPAVHPTTLLRDDREKLFRRCWSTIADPEKYLAQWFRGARKEDIKRENVSEFLQWAFFNVEKVPETDEEEVELYIKEIEKKLGRDLSPGRGKAKSIRSTLESVGCSHRSLFWYLVRHFLINRSMYWYTNHHFSQCITVVDTITYCSMLLNGFHLYRTSASKFFKLFPFRPLALLSTKQSPAKYLTYWYRPHSSNSRLPVLFIHGIGVGLYPYTNFLRDVTGAGGDDFEVGVIALELMNVSSRITYQAFDKDVLVEEIRTILKHHGWSKCILIGHSYGTVICTHLLKSQLTTSLIGPVILVDPICFLLHLPDVAYNFTIRKPGHVKELILWYFGSKDIGVAHTLARRFFWQENILWKEDFDVDSKQNAEYRMVTVVLSGKDDVVNVEAVKQYLTASSSDGSNTKTRSLSKTEENRVEADLGLVDEEIGSIGDMSWRRECIKVVLFDDFHHAQVFDVKTARQSVARMIRIQSKHGKKKTC